jgi:hypothetical protein
MVKKNRNSNNQKGGVKKKLLINVFFFVTVFCLVVDYAAEEYRTNRSRRSRPVLTELFRLEARSPATGVGSRRHTRSQLQSEHPADAAAVRLEKYNPKGSLGSGATPLPGTLRDDGAGGASRGVDVQVGVGLGAVSVEGLTAGAD